jgi:hypothetical protein
LRLGNTKVAALQFKSIVELLVEFDRKAHMIPVDQPKVSGFKINLATPYAGFGYGALGKKYPLKAG